MPRAPDHPALQVGSPDELIPYATVPPLKPSRVSGMVACGTRCCSRSTLCNKPPSVKSPVASPDVAAGKGRALPAKEPLAYCQLTHFRSSLQGRRAHQAPSTSIWRYTSPYTPARHSSMNGPLLHLLSISISTNFEPHGTDAG